MPVGAAAPKSVVIPAKAGIHQASTSVTALISLDPRFRGGDGNHLNLLKFENTLPHQGRV